MGRHSHKDEHQTTKAQAKEPGVVRRNLYLLVPLLIVLGGIFLVTTMATTIERNKTAEAMSKAELSARVYTSLLTGDIEKGVGITNTLERHIVSAQGELPSFTSMAENLMADYIQSIQIAPDGVVTQIYPAEGNEAGLIDLIDRDDERGQICRYARDNDVVVMQGPFELLQGGTGIAIRNPVYLEKDGQRSFWGFAIAIIRVPEVFEDSVSTLADEGYAYRLSKASTPDGTDYVEVCSSSELADNAVVHDFTAAGIPWRLELSSIGGWYNPASNTMTNVVNMAFFISMAVIVFMAMRHNMRKEESRRLAMAGDIERLENERALKSQVQTYAAAMGVEYPLAADMDYLGNRYQMIEYSEFLSESGLTQGTVDDLIASVVSAIPDEEQAAQFTKLFGRERIVGAFRAGTTEISLMHKQTGEDGQVHWMRTKAICVERTDTAVRGVLLSKCIDDQVRNEQLRIEAERANAAKTSFLRRMSHDVRTPINGIRGEVLIAQSDVDNADLQRDCRRKILEASDYLLVLVNNILDMSKLESGTNELAREPFNLGEALEACASLASAQATEQGVTFVVDGSLANVPHPRVMGSPKHLKQVLTNLSTNAVKYNRPGGSITVSCRELSCDEATVWYEFTCADTGIGMSEEFQAHMYDAFSQEERDENVTAAGTGLGLAIVHDLVDLMGGRIECESRVGQGTTFRVSLPFELDQREPQEACEKAAETDVSGKRALLVEDNELNREIACFILEQEGLVVECATNGKEGVDAFEASPEGHFDIVFMDVMMPVMNGLDAARAIRALDRADARRVPIVAMTANAFLDDIKRSMDAGMNEHLAKPVEPARIHEVIQRLLG